ncbi:MAG: hypothetical protein Q4D51_06675 [Eubacteriales bacterium]|nr:hypothetical protein [Eubacteriales bacterium]
MKKLVKGMLMATMIGALSFGAGVNVNAKKPVKDSSDKQVVTQQKEKKQKKIKLSKVTCTASGKLNISFKEKVNYADTLNIVLTDEAGTEIPCTISKKKKSSMTIAVKGLVKGQSYQLSISGLVSQKTNEAVTVEQTFKAKGIKTACKAEKVSVSKANNVSLKLKGSACYKDAVVEVKDENGTVYEAKIVKKAKGSIKIAVEGLEKGKKYKVTISGIKTKKEKNYSSITTSFKAK